MKYLSLSMLLAVFAADATAQTPRALFLLDRSGSMTLGSPVSRCDNAMMACKNDILSFLSTFPNGEITVREFADSPLPSGTGLVGSRFIPGFSEWHSSAISGSVANAISDAQMAVDNAVACNGLTPLADAVCDSSSALSIRATVAGPSSECFVYMYADGGENSSSGACTGPTACNATTGRCSFDSHHTGLPFEAECGTGLTSWQQKACGSIELLNLTCDFVFNVYKFSSFTLVPDPGLVFLESAATGTGGLVVNVQDGQTIPSTSPLEVRQTSCTNNVGFEPLLLSTGLPQLGTLFSLRVSAPNSVRFIMLGQTELAPPVSLAPIGAAPCVLGVQPFDVHSSALFPLFIPPLPNLVGFEFLAQGGAIDTSAQTTPWLLTTNTLKVTIVN